MRDPAGEVSIGPARALWTARADGDLHSASPGVADRQRLVLDRPWSSVRQVHGAGVFVVDEPGGGGVEADGLVGRHPGVALSIKTADCASVAFASPEAVIGAAHAGWRGLVAGVIEATVEAMRALGATTVTAALGPCIHAECYEFSPADLDEVAARFGEVVRGRTTDGRLALDVPAAVRAAVTAARVDLVHDVDICTACSAEYWSHRADADPERQALVVWVPE